MKGRLSGGETVPVSAARFYGRARTWKRSFQVSLCIYVTQTNSFLERAALLHSDT